MNRILISVIIITALIGFAVALDVENGVEMRPGEAAAERLFEHGIGEPWVGGNPPGWGYDPFSYYSYQGKTYHPHLYSYYYYYPHVYHWYPYPYFRDYWWDW